MESLQDKLYVSGIRKSRKQPKKPVFTTRQLNNTEEHGQHVQQAASNSQNEEPKSMRAKTLVAQTQALHSLRTPNFISALQLSRKQLDHLAGGMFIDLELDPALDPVIYNVRPKSGALQVSDND